MSLLHRLLGVLACLHDSHACVLACSRAWCACVLTCWCAGVLGVLTCLVCLRALAFGVFTCLRVYVFSVRACFMSLRAVMSYMLAVFKYLTCLRACVLLWHYLSYFLYIWKVNFHGSLNRKISFYSEKYLEPTWTSMNGFFVKEKPFTFFAKRLHFRFSTEFYIYFIFMIPI